MDTSREPPSFHRCDCQACRRQPDGATAQQHRALNQLVAVADERTRRLLAGFLAQQHGRGGIAWLARITGLSPHTIRRGGRELRHGDPLPAGRVRHPGAGRKRAEVKDPGS